VKIGCPYCPHTVRAGDPATGRAYLVASHVCEVGTDRPDLLDDAGADRADRERQARIEQQISAY
jgi:hypothetical protein